MKGWTRRVRAAVPRVQVLRNSEPPRSTAARASVGRGAAAAGRGQGSGRHLPRPTQRERKTLVTRNLKLDVHAISSRHRDVTN